MTSDHAEGPQYRVLPTEDPLRVVNIVSKLPGYHHFLMSTMTPAAEPVRADFERREPRCRICRVEAVRILVNERLDWRGVPVIAKGGKTHRITLTEILRSLEPLNEGRDTRDRITYDSLWIHAKRHYDLAGKAAYWSTRTYKEFKKALRVTGCRTPIEQPQRSSH